MKARTLRPKRQVLTNTTAFEDVLAEQLKDPTFRREWERTELAREVSYVVIRYRAKHRLTQGQLARKLGVTQPYVANLEEGDHNPGIGTLKKLANALDLSLAIEVRPRCALRLRALRPRVSA